MIHNKILGRYAKIWIFHENSIMQNYFSKVSAWLSNHAVCKIGLTRQTERCGHLLLAALPQKEMKKYLPIQNAFLQARIRRSATNCERHKYNKVPLCKYMIKWLLHFVLSCFLFCRMVQNGPRVCFYFCSKVWSSELFTLPRTERNSECLLLFLFHGTEFRVVFSSVKGFPTVFREFSVPRNSRNFVGNNHMFRLFRLSRNYLFVENSQPYYLSVYFQSP